MMKRVLVLFAVLCLSDAVTFGPLCEGNPTNRRRASDSWGSGHYGAGRNGRRHEGLDVYCADGSAVYAPLDVTLERRVIVYNKAEKAAIDKGVQMRGGGLCFKLFYVDPDRVSGTVRKGQRIGTMLPMQQVYPGITSHIHVQMCDKSDPTPYF
ncbi:uncharacterized protein V6R79_011306 [Siganus canaliculatus]